MNKSTSSTTNLHSKPSHSKPTASRSKYLNTIIDGKWRVMATSHTKHHSYYTLANIYNDMRITVSDSVFKRVLAGTTSISHVMYKRGIRSRVFKPF